MGILDLFRSIFGNQQNKQPTSDPYKCRSIAHERLPIRELEPLGYQHFDHALEFWFANRREDGPPDWSSFQPGKHPALLPHLILYEKIGDRYATRITGDALTPYLIDKPAGKFLDEITPRDRLDDIVMRLDRALADGLPNYVEKVRLWKEDSKFYGYNALSMPFDSKDKGLVRVLCVLQFHSTKIDY